MINTGLVVGGIAIAISLLMWAYIPTQLEGVGNPQEFIDINEKINLNELNRDGQIAGIRDTYNGAVSRIDTQLQLIQLDIEDLKSNKNIDFDTVQPPSFVTADLEIKAFVDSGQNIESRFFPRGEIINFSAYNSDDKKDIEFYFIDPNGDATKKLTKNSNQGYFTWVYTFPDNALTGKYTLVLEINGKTDSLNLTITD